MLPKECRIVYTKDVQAAFKSRNKAYSKHTRILSRDTSTGRFRLLVVVGKKMYKKAYMRNRMKRKIHAIFEHELLHNSLPINMDCVIQVSDKAFIERDMDDLRKELLPKVRSLSKLNKSGT